MDALAFWATLLLLLPGAGFLLISTLARYARLFRNDLALLYACAELFATVGLLGHMFVLDTEWALTTVGAIMCTGILALAAATAFLIRESLLSAEGLEALARSPSYSTHGRSPDPLRRRR